ncbi:hypothetical protein ACMYSQ_008007 [Aspergillus niger]
MLLLLLVMFQQFQLSGSFTLVPSYIIMESTKDDVCTVIQAASSENEKNDDSQTLVDSEESSSFPEGGWRAWLVVLGAWCAIFPTMGIMNLYGLLEDWLAEHQLHEYSKASISWIFSLWLFFFYLGGIQIGMHRFHSDARTSTDTSWRAHI